MKRRFLAMLLSLVMVFAMLPVSAFAADDDAVTAPAAGDDNENVTTTDETDPTDDVKTDATDTNPSETDADDGDDVETNEDPTATATDPVLTVNFFADGAKGKAAKWGDDCERNTIRTVATKLDSSKEYVMTVTTPSGLHFNSSADSFRTPTDNANATELVIGPGPTGPETENGPNTCAGWMFSIKPWGERATDDYTVVANSEGSISGDYIIKLYQKKADTTKAGDYVAENYETNPLKTATLTLTTATVDFGTNGDVTTSIYQEENKGYGNPPTFFFDASSDKTKATFYVDEADLTAGENESARDVLLKLISFSKDENSSESVALSEGDTEEATDDPTDDTRFPDGKGKKWVYDSSTRTFTYTDAVTVEAAKSDGTTTDPNISVPEGKELVEITDNNATIEVGVAENYIPKATGADNAAIKFTRTTAASGSTKATWTATVAKTAIPDTKTISVSAAPAISVTAGTGVGLPDENVVTGSTTPKVAMFEITPASETTKATATITVTCDRQPVTVPADFGTFEKDTTNSAVTNSWKLVKQDAKAAAITVNQEGEVTEIADLTATATRGTAAADGKVSIKLDVADADGKAVETFKYKVSSDEPTKPEITANASTGYSDYSKDVGFVYEDGNDYVAVATVNGSGEITAWGLAVIPKDKAEANTTVEVETGSDGTTSVNADADKKEVDTALEAAIQATPAQGETTTTAKLDFTTDANGNEVKADNAEITIPAESIDKVVEHNDKAETEEGATPVSVAIATPAGDVVADPAVLDAIKETEVEGVPTTGVSNVETKVVLSIKKDTVAEGTTDVPKTEAESFNIEFKKVTTYTPAGGGTEQTKTATVVVETAVTVTVPTNVEPKTGNTLFAYFMKAADKLLYVGTATKTGTRATFTAPHLSTYVLYAEVDPNGGIGVNLITENADGSEDQEPIIFKATDDPKKFEYTIELGEDEASVILGIPKTVEDLSYASPTGGTYDEETGEFALGRGKTSATMVFTKGEGENAITYTLILKVKDTTEEDDSSAPTDITIGGTADDTVKFESDPTNPNQKTAEVTVSSSGSAISFKVASGATVTWKKADGTSETLNPGADGTTITATVNPGDKIEIVSGTTTYVMDFKAPVATGALAPTVVPMNTTTEDGTTLHTQDKISVPYKTDCRYVFRIKFNNKPELNWFMFTSTDGSVIVPYSASGYTVEIFEYDSSVTGDLIQNGSYVTGFSNHTDDGAGGYVVNITE